MLGIAARYSDEQIHGPAQAVHLNDLGDSLEFCCDPWQVSLADRDVEECLNGKTQSGGGESPFVREEDACLVAPRPPRLHGVPRQTEAIRQCHHGRARVRRERSQELKVDMVKSGHIAEG